MQKHNWIKPVLISVLILAIAAGIGWLVHAEQKKNSTPEEIHPFGVINYEQLLPEHPDYTQLEELDRQIASIAPEPVNPEKLQEVNAQLSGKMDKYQKELGTLLEKEQARIHQETQAKARALHSQLEAAFNAKQADLLKYRDQLEKEYAKTNNDANRALSPSEKEFSSRVQNRANDLLILKERQLAAKRLELDKKSSEKLMGLENNVVQKISAYEEELRAQNQNRKLDLQLKLQIAKTEDERNDIENQLKDLYLEEESKVQAKRKEFTVELDALKDKEIAANEAAMKKYRTTLDADVNRQLDAIKQKVADEMYREGISKGTENPFVPKEMQEKLKVRQEKMQEEMKVLQARVDSQVKALQDNASQEFEARKSQIISKLEAYQKTLAQEFDRKRDELVKEIESSNSERNKARKALIDQRKRLFERQLEDINQVVSEIAKKRNVTTVVGSYVTSVNAVDLTEDAKSALIAKQPASSPAPRISPTTVQGEVTSSPTDEEPGKGNTDLPTGSDSGSVRPGTPSYRPGGGTMPNPLEPSGPSRIRF